MPEFHRKMQGKLRTEEEGADTIVWLSGTKGLTEEDNGRFFFDRERAITHLRYRENGTL